MKSATSPSRDREQFIHKGEFLMQDVWRKSDMPRSTCTSALLCAALCISPHAAQADFIQQGDKLFGTGADGAALQGISVAMSADGSTAIVGGYADNSLTGAAWVYTRSGGVWTQQGSKLVGTGAIGVASQGFSVALSADGNTAIVGGHSDDNYAGAAWVYTRSGGVWTQQGSKLVGTGVVGGRPNKASPSRCPPTAIPPSSAGMAPNSIVGAAWVFTRSGGVWTQQGSKLVGTGAVGLAPTKAGPSRCPPTATPPSSAGMATTAVPGRRGSSPAAAESGPSKAASWSAPERLEPPTRLVRRAVRRRQHRHRRRVERQRQRRGGVGLHPQRRDLDPARQQAGRHRSGWRGSTRLSLSRCPPTATPPSSAGMPTTTSPGRRGSTPAVAASGPSSAASWSAPE